MSDSFGPFKFLTGDVSYTDYGGKWWKRMSGRRYHVIELLNWQEAVGERDAAEIGATYNVSLSEMDLDVIPAKEIASALRSCGWEIVANGDIENEHDGATVAAKGADYYDLVIVEACHGYGLKAPLSDENGNSYHKLMREAVSYSHRLRTPREHRKAMRKPVNRIGSTAAEYMQGDITSALVRGVVAGDGTALLMAKIETASAKEGK